MKHPKAYLKTPYDRNVRILTGESPSVNDNPSVHFHLHFNSNVKFIWSNINITEYTVDHYKRNVSLFHSTENTIME